jgi:1,4-alpha-glucan branching enzyme
MPNTKLLLILQAHLPYVRHPEHSRFLEEDWLFEALSETYLPLLRVFDRLKADEVPFRLAISISPSLASMLEDPLLQGRYTEHLRRLIELAEKEVERTAGMPAFRRVAQMYLDLFRENLTDFTGRYDNNILRGLDYYWKKGYVELLTSAATHLFLPHYQHYPETIKAQVSIAERFHSTTFGKSPRGFWLPECGYFPGVEEVLKEYGFDYFVAASHGVLFSQDRPHNGVYRPLACPNGVAVFGRDVYSAHQVWSSEDGYPGDPTYRDFYRDIGFDLPLDYIGPYVHRGSLRAFTGLKYYAITGPTDQKYPYDPDRAAETVEEHADNFVYNIERLVERVSPLVDGTPVITAPFDAELFGHWWFEGPAWLEAVIRRLAREDSVATLETPKQVLKQTPPDQTIQPAYSSWGTKGYSEVWLDGSNDWIYRHTHHATERMRELTERFPDERGLKERALAQAARETLLAQASDWPFMIRSGTTVAYAVRRIKEHVLNVEAIYDSLCRGTVSTEWLTKLEKRHNLFPHLNYRLFSSNPPSKRTPAFLE